MVWLGLASSRPLSHPVPYLPQTTLRLHLNAFRGEPAISGFDWHFTSTHSSSQPFAPDTGSVLHSDVIGASTWPWVAHPVSGLIQTTHRAWWRLRLPLCDHAPVRPRQAGTVAERNCAAGSLHLRAVHALFRLAFAAAPELLFLNLAAQINSPAHSSIGTQSSRLTPELLRLVGPRFQVYFTPLQGFFSPFPHGTGSLSVAKSI